MSNVLGYDKQQQVLALGRLGWSLRRIEDATGVRRETASTYLKAAAFAVRERGGRPRMWPPANPATSAEVPTDSAAADPAPAPDGAPDKRSASTRKIKIPDACIGLGVKCMTPFEMLRRERARFVLGP